MPTTSFNKSLNSATYQVANQLPTLTKRKGSSNECYNQTATVKTQEGDVYGFQCCGSSEMNDLLGYAQKNNATLQNNIWSSQWTARGPELEGCVVSAANTNAVSIGFEQGLANAVQAAQNASNASNTHAEKIAMGTIMPLCFIGVVFLIYKTFFKGCISGVRADRAERRARNTDIEANRQRQTNRGFPMNVLVSRSTGDTLAYPPPTYAVAVANGGTPDFSEGLVSR